MYKNRVFETIKQAILDKTGMLSTDEGTFVSDMVSPIALEIESCYAEFSKILDIAFLDKLSGELLELKALEYGINRKNGTLSTGEILFAGEVGTLVPKGSLVSTVSGIIFKTLDEITLLQSSAKVSIIATNVGSNYNLMQNLITNIPVAINGVYSVTNERKTSGGSNIETDEELLKRVLFFLQTPATSGNVHDYIKWATSIDGISDARVFPLENGPGTVMVVPVTSEKQSPSDIKINEISDYIETVRPIGALVTVLAPTEIPINIAAEISIESGFNLQDIKTKYLKLVENYIKESIFTTSVVDKNRCLSFFYEVLGIVSVNNILINGSNLNVILEDTHIQVLGEITLTEVSL